MADPSCYPRIDPARLAEARARTQSLVARRARQFVGVVESIEGELVRVDGSGMRGTDMEKGERLAAPVHLQLEHGRALIRMVDGSDIWLTGNSHLDASAWGPGRRELNLRQGKLLAMVAPGKDAPFEVVSGTRRALAVGTTFSVDANADRFAVAVQKGRVRVETESQSRMVKAGMCVAVGGSGALTASKIAAGSLAEWGDLSASLGNASIAKEAAVAIGAKSWVAANAAMIGLSVIFLCGFGWMVNQRLSIARDQRSAVVSPLLTQGGAEGIRELHRGRVVHAQIIAGALRQGERLPDEVLRPGRNSPLAAPEFAQAMAERRKNTYQGNVALARIVDELCATELSVEEVQHLSENLRVLHVELQKHAGARGRVTRAAADIVPGWNQARVEDFKAGRMPVIVQLDVEAMYHPAFVTGYIKYGIAIWEPLRMPAVIP